MFYKHETEVNGSPVAVAGDTYDRWISLVVRGEMVFLTNSEAFDLGTALREAALVVGA